MPLKSYLAFPRHGQRDALAEILARMPHCEAVAANNREVVVLITDTPDDAAEQRLEESLHAIEPLQFLSLVAGAAMEATEVHA